MTSKRIAKIAVSTAMLSGVKLALGFVPNVEIVSLLLCLYALTFKRQDAVVISVLFVFIEILLFGFALWWVLLYIIYWPLFAVTISLLPKKNTKTKIILSALVVVFLTAFFGVLSTFIEVSLVSSLSTTGFWVRFYFRYFAGISFFVTHIVSNAIIMTALLPPLYAIIMKIEKQKTQ